MFFGTQCTSISDRDWNLLAYFQRYFSVALRA